MTSQRDRASLTIASPTEIERTARQLSRIREHYLSVGESTLPARSVILESWRRCSALGVSPAKRAAPLAAARESQVQQLREASEPLLRSAAPVLGYLSDFLTDSGYVVVLSDAQGRLLEVEGDPTIRRKLASIDFMPGGAWNEASAGTNAIGTAIATGHCVQLMAAEHFCEGWQDLTCTAAPIRDPLSGELVGVLDVTGAYRLIRPFLTGLLSAAALEIQQHLRHLSAPQRAPAPRRLFPSATVSLPYALKPSKVLMSSPKRALLTSDSRPAARAEGALSHHERRARDAERLAAATGMISASLDLTVTIEKVAEQMAYLLGLECAAVCLYATDDDVPEPHIWSQRDEAQAERKRALAALIRRAEGVDLVRERGEIVLIDSLDGEELLAPNAVAQLGFGGLALLPLATARGISGFIAAPRSSSCHWETEDIRLGLALAAQAATALENARLFAMLSRHNRYIEALNAMIQFLNSLLDPAERLDLVLERIADSMDLDAGLVLLRRPDSDELALAAHCGLTDASILGADQHASLQPLYALGQSVASGGKPLLCCSLRDGRGEPQVQLVALGFCDLMAVPLAVGNVALGVLLIGSQRHRSLTDEDLTLFTTIAQQLALALHNAQLLRAASEMEALRAADRLKSQFLAAVSHDLRSPLTAIRASVEGLLDGDAEPYTAQEQLLQNIAGQAGRLGRLVDQLLDLSRIEAGALDLDRDWTELPTLIADTIDKFCELNPGCAIQRRIAADLPLQYVDPDSIVQVLWNLLENAYKYAPPHAPIHVAACRTANEVRIAIADRGPGIPPSERQKIFQHFYRMKREHRLHTQGSGLGLAICRGIVDAHGGRIWVDERPGGGSVFRVALPLTADEALLEPLDEWELVGDAQQGASA
jgi:signal transduction histidine kinase